MYRQETTRKVVFCFLKAIYGEYFPLPKSRVYCNVEVAKEILVPNKRFFIFSRLPFLGQSLKGLGMKRERGAFRMAAKEAYKRLSSGFWQNETLKRERKISALAMRGIEIEKARSFFVKETKNKLSSNALDAEAERFYQRVRSILKKGQDSPISLLLDREYMSSISDVERERYVFEMSARIRDCIKRFENESEFVMTEGSFSTNSQVFVETLCVND